MGDELISRRILELAGPEKRLACSEAFRLAGELGVSPAEVGRKSNELGVKIKGCQLGCF